MNSPTLTESETDPTLKKKPTQSYGSTADRQPLGRGDKDPTRCKMFQWNRHRELEDAGTLVGSESDERLFEGTLQCPTCRGTGRIPRDHPSLTSNSASPQEQASKDGARTSCVSVDKDIYGKIRKEMRDEGVSQEVFAAVSFGRTQGLLSDMLKKGDLGVVQSSTVQNNLAAISQFLARPREDRIQMYDDYRQGGRRYKRLHQETTQSCSGGHNKQVVISANAKGVMLEYYDRVSPSPDPPALEVFAAVLNLDKTIISHFFKNEKKRRKMLEASRKDTSCSEEDN